MTPVILALISLLISGSCAVRQATVTNEDIRDAILQVVNVVRTNDGKLERHEYRERALGEQLKKGMISIDKRIKLLEPFKGTITRLDSRLATVETILMQKDERERIQLQKTYDIVEDIQKNLPVIVELLKNDLVKLLNEHTQNNTNYINKLINQTINNNNNNKKDQEPKITKKDLEKFEKGINDKIENVSKTIKTMENDLKKMQQDQINNMKDINNRSNDNLDKVKRQLSSSEQLLAKYENKLAEYNNRIPNIGMDIYKEQNDWHTNFRQALEKQKSTLEQILADIRTITQHFNKLPEKTDLETFKNITDYNFEQLTNLGLLNNKQIIEFTLNTTMNNNNLIEKIDNNINDRYNETVDSINNLLTNFDNLTKKIDDNFKELRTDIDSLGKVEQVMIQTADSVLDTKRRVEYGVHQIIAEMQQAIKASSKDVDAAISERFDTFEMAMLDEENGALTNLTAKIGQEIAQVWRQIGIMHQQMSASTDTLNKLQNQTDFYVNGSFNVMDNMKGKVTTITSRITEVDDNLNYLLGKLSLVTQEFNQIKSGLGKALDEMRGTYQTVKDKLNKGPHRIESDEN